MLCGAAALLFPALGSTGMERAEIYFLDGARAMLESGDWLVPHYRGEPFFDKPPLTYWLMAVSMKLFGPTAAAGRAEMGGMDRDQGAQAAFPIGDEMHELMLVEIRKVPERVHVLSCVEGGEWGDRRDLNPRPSVPQTDALTS